MKHLVVCCFVLTLCAFAHADQEKHADHSNAAKKEEHASCPHHAQEEKQASHADCPHSDLEKRGDQVMGFDHTKTTHHFFLTKNGGAVMAEANDSADHETIQKIKKHLSEIARVFSAGDFSMPEKIHGRVPPGVPEMTKYANEIKYTLKESSKGGTVQIETTHPEALAGVHSFLRFQIDDHKTGDPKEPQ